MVLGVPILKHFILPIDLSDTLENEVKETLTMEEEKIRITNKPQRDPEFIR